MVTAEVVINNARINHRAGSIRVSRAVGQRGTAEFDVMDSEIIPREGDEAGIFDHGIGIFNGTIHEIKRTPSAPTAGAPAWYRCLCTSWEHRLDRHRIDAHAYYGMSAGQIVQEILENFAAGEVHIGQIDPGASSGELGTLIFRGRTVADALTELAERSNYIWHVDNLLNFYFVPRTYEQAALSVTAAAKNYREPEITSTRADYFNQVSIAISHEAAPPRTFTISGDQSYPSFLLWDENAPAYEPVYGQIGTPYQLWNFGNYMLSILPYLLPVDVIVRITLNGVEQSVGVYAENATATFLYVQGQPWIMWNPLSVPPSAADRVMVEFYPLGGNILTVKDDLEIAARAAIEFDSGVYAAYLEDLDCKDLAEARSRCEAFLNLHAPARSNPALAAGTMPREYRWAMFSHELRDGIGTYVASLWPGRVIRFNPSTPTSEDVNVVIQSVEGQEIEASAPLGQRVGAGMLRYDITAIDCSKLAGYFDFYRALAEVGGGGMATGKTGAEVRAQTGDEWTLSMGLSGDLSAQTGFTEKTLSIPIGKVLQLTRAEANVDVAADADIRLDAEYSTDGGSTWSPIFLVSSPAVYPTIPSGAKQMASPYGQFHTYPSASTLPARCLVRGSIIACGSTTPGAGLHFDLIGELRAAT